LKARFRRILQHSWRLCAQFDKFAHMLIIVHVDVHEYVSAQVCYWQEQDVAFILHSDPRDNES
jgi:hypothetical protein